MRMLFLQAPSFDGFDGGAGLRFQCRREIRPFRYPTWLAQPVALVEGSNLVDAPLHGLKVAAVAPMARDCGLAVAHTSSPSFAAEKMKRRLRKSVEFFHFLRERREATH